MPQALLVMTESTYRLQFGDEQLTRLRSLVTLGDPVAVTDLDAPEVRRRLAEVDAVITSWGAPALTAEVLDAAPKLGLVAHAAGSVRGIVTDSVHARGVTVTTAADVNAVPVAEFALAAVIMAGKKAPFLARRGPAAPWPDAAARARLGNRGRRIGVVGFSRTGRALMERLRILEPAEILVADPYADETQVAALGGQLAGLDETLAGSEILSLHAPALPATRRMIGARELALMPDGATLINTARGALLDHEALAAEAVTGRIDAILDVTDPEPLPADSPLHALENVVITPHIAGSLGEEARRMSDHAIDELGRWLAGEPLVGRLDPDVAALTA
ncbi:hydroxyacid dehydrogenase [Georgenia deserti]|uniref:Hydroxyacid dehydrogenase n=1 Tax=Georgenia deserti TaxID=2093781 RepID=A0ABW4L143_9MICO